MEHSNTQTAKQGFVLVLVLIISMVILTSAGIWLKNGVILHHLTRRFVDQTVLESECDSLLPFVRSRLQILEESELSEAQSGFLSIRDKNGKRWTIDRGEWHNERVKLIFYFHKSSLQPVIYDLAFAPEFP